MKKFINFNNVLRDQQLNTQIQIYMSKLTAGEDYDSFGNNYTPTNLNPVTIYGYVRDMLPETAYWKQYGLYQSGLIEIICEQRFEQYFRLCNQVVINRNGQNTTYQVYIEGTGNKAMITRRPGQLLRVVLARDS